MVMSRFVDCDRDQAFLLPPDLRDWIPEDDLAHVVLEAVDLVDLSVFKVNRRGTGSAQYHPRMMLALLIYCYANGIFSSRRIERATYRDIGVRFVAANRHPDHDTIASFRRENVEAIAGSFLRVLLLATEV
jgi:transposase